MGMYRYDKETRGHAVGAALVFFSLFATILLKYDHLCLPLSIILPSAASLGAFLFIFQTFSTGIALRPNKGTPTKVYRKDKSSGFYGTAITSSLAVVALAAFPIAAGYVAWQRALA